MPPVGGPTEIVRENSDGFQISCYEIEKIKFLMENSNEYTRLSKNARERVKDFDIKVFDEEIINVLKDME